MDEIRSFFNKKSNNEQFDKNKLYPIVKQLNIIYEEKEYLKNFVKYIFDKIKSNYPELLDLDTKQKEKILYRRVEKNNKSKLKKCTFEDFNKVFTEKTKDIYEGKY